MRRLFLLEVALLFAAAWQPAFAQAPPMSPEIPVNTYTTGTQQYSSVAMDGAGNFVVAWQTYDADGNGISARTFDDTGNPLTPEFSVNTYTTNDQYHPWVAADRNGDFVVVWTSFGQVDPTNADVFARRYVGGNPVGPEFLVNTYTTGDQYVNDQGIAMAPSGEFVVVWVSKGQDGSGYGIFGQRYDASANRLGSEFQVNTYTTGAQSYGAVAMDAGRDFVVVWQSNGQDGSNYGIFARRYDPSGTALTGEIPVNTYTTGFQHAPSVAMDQSGNFVVVWNSYGEDGSFDGVFGRQFAASGVPLTAEFPVNTYTTGTQLFPQVAMDPDGNFLCTWQSEGEDGSLFGVFARAFDSSTTPLGAEFLVNVVTTGNQQFPTIATGHHGNFVITWGGDTATGRDIFARLSGPSAGHQDVDVRAVAGSSSNTNGVLEAGETVQVAPRWANNLASAIALTGTASNIRGPFGPTYTLEDTSADYGAIAPGALNDCFDATGNCYLVSVSGARPAAHWDIMFDETLSTGTIKTWTLHVGESFSDVPVSDAFYSYVETIFHNGITGGCSTGLYCPVASVTRAQMAVFLLKTEHGSGYVPPACAGLFGDVTCPSQYANWIEQLYNEDITGGCGGGDYCPDNPVTRAQMAVFLLKVEHGSDYAPPACAGIFGDVPCPSPFANWIEQLYNEGVTGGCGSGDYCPGNPNTRGQMAVFLTKTFGLQLYPP